MDHLDQNQRSRLMGKIHGKDTRPEMKLRSLVHGMGYRYRLHGRDLPGTPDLVFPSRRRVIFMHGCFWHQHPDPSCRRTKLPVTRGEFWKNKLEGNRRRDIKTETRLLELGWSSLVIWECELSDLDQLRPRICEFLG